MTIPANQALSVQRQLVARRLAARVRAWGGAHEDATVKRTSAFFAHRRDARLSVLTTGVRSDATLACVRQHLHTLPRREGRPKTGAARPPAGLVD